MADKPLFIGAPRNQITTFVPGFSTRPRLIFLPGSLGAKVTAIVVSSGDAGANTLQIALAKKLTSSADMGVGAFVDGGGGSDSITRTTGSFVTDGWRDGNRLAAQDAQTLANDFGILLTSVSALSLVFATGTVAAAENFTANTTLWQLARTWAVAVPANAGTPSAVSVSGLDTTQAPALDDKPDREIEVQNGFALFAWLGTTLVAGEVIDVSVIGGDY